MVFLTSLLLYILLSAHAFGDSTMSSEVTKSLLINKKDKIFLNWKSSVGVEKNNRGQFDVFIWLRVPENYIIEKGKKVNNKKDGNYRLRVSSHFNKYQVLIKGKKNKTISKATLFVEIKPLETRVFLDDSCFNNLKVSILKSKKSKRYITIQNCIKDKTKKTQAQIIDMLDLSKAPTLVKISDKLKTFSFDSSFVLSEKNRKSTESNYKSTSEKESEVKSKLKKNNFGFFYGISVNSYNFYNKKSFPNIGGVLRKKVSLYGINMSNTINIDLVSLRNKAFRDNKAMSIFSELSHTNFNFNILSKLIRPYVEIRYRFFDIKNTASNSYLSLPVGVSFELGSKLKIKPSISLISTKSNFTSLATKAEFNHNDHLYYINIIKTKFGSGSDKVSFVGVGGGIAFYY